MLLKVKSLKFLAGRPVAIIHQKVSQKLDVHSGERVAIRKKKDHQEIISIVDIATGILKEDEIVVSYEIFKKLRLREDSLVDIEPALKPLSTNFILKKLQGKKLSYTEIFSIMKDIYKNSLTETEIAYFISGMYVYGMNDNETIALTNAMVKIGKILDLNKKMIIDKHSIGGIAGNRTTPIVIAICAATGLVMPKTSSRAITSAAGTADVIETLCNVEFSLEEIKKIVNKNNACLVWGGSLGLAPTDDKIIQVERIMGIDPQAQLIASILAKKVSVGATHFLLDIPFGKGAKVNFGQAKKLAKKFHKISTLLGLKIMIALTDGNQPIGKGIGPVLEMRDILAVLVREKSRPLDLEAKAIVLAGLIFELAGKTKKGHGKRLASYILNSGQALEKFKEIIKAQHGNFGDLNEKLRLANFKKIIIAEEHGKIEEMNNKKINFVARVAGCPADKRAGLYLHKQVGDFVKKNDIIATIYSENKRKLNYAEKIFKDSKAIVIN